MASGRVRFVRNLLGSVVVVGLVALLGLGLPAVNNTIPASRPVSSREPYEVGAGITVVPPAGAGLDVTRTRPSASGGSALFVIGSVRYAIVAVPYPGSLASAAASLRTKITRTRGYQVTSPEAAIRTRSGVTGRQGMYSSAGREGRYAVFLADGTAVEITVAGNAMDLRRVLPVVEASVLTILFPEPADR